MRQDVIKADEVDPKGLMLFALRMVIVVAFLWHALPRLFDSSIIMKEIVTFGFPAVIGPVIIWIEIIAALLIFIGLWSHWASLALSFLVFFIIVSVDLNANITAAIIGTEIPKEIDTNIVVNLIVLFATLTIATNGPGLLSIKKGGFFNRNDDTKWY